MAENTEQLKKKDLEAFLEVNRKAIEIETEVAGQNEEIISLLEDTKTKQDELSGKADQIIKKNEEIERSLFKTQVLLITGVISLIAQIVQIILRK